MMHLSKVLLIGAASFVTCGLPTLGLARSPSDAICESAAAYLSRNQIVPQNGAVLVAIGNYWDNGWTPKQYDSRITVPSAVQQIYLAYLINRPYSPAAGAIAVKVSRAEVEGSNDRSNYVDLHRSEIYRDTNSCEPRGRRQRDRQVRVNEYIDYHNGTGISSTLEDFHFRYPKEDGVCQRTDNVASRRDFQFDNVQPTKDDTFIARNLSFIGTAYAVGHKFSILKTELHYRSKAVSQTGSCIGVYVPIGRSPKTNVVVTEQGFGGFLSGQSLTIDRAPQN
jgi:hypothetical protein